MADSEANAKRAPLTPYQRKLYWFLSVAAFFDGYDLLAITQILPNLRESMALSESVGGAMVGVINIGTILAYWLVRRADQWGRRPVLTWTIAGYTTFTALTALSPNVYVFAVLQLLTRVFLLAESAVANVVVSEEFPAARRGTVLGVVSGFSGLGAVTCAGVAPLLLSTPLGWRSVYLVGIAPLILVMILRRQLKETGRFESSSIEQRSESIWHIWRTPYRGRAAQLAVVWFFSYLAPQTAVSFWKEYAVGELNFSNEDVGAVVTVSALGAMPLIFLAGKLIDRSGRRVGAIVIYLVCMAGVFGSYTFADSKLLMLSLAAAIFGASAFLPLLNAYTTELFPTSLRGAAFAWCNNLLGRIGYVGAPFVVGWVAETEGWGAAVRPVAVFPLVALALVWIWLPETTRLELEDTANL